MHDEPSHTSGGVPHAYRQAVFWRWAPEMPRQLRGGFLTLLYAVAAAASTSGATRFKDGSPIRISDLARATGSDEKDARRYLNAAIEAGVLTTQGERRRGRATVYVLVVTPVPDWTAAVASLEASKRQRKQPAPPWKKDTEFGGPTPEPATPQSSGDQPPNPPQSSSGDQPPYGFGGPTPERFGGPTPEQPRGTQVLPQEMAGAVPQPQDARGLAPENDDSPRADEETQPPLRGLPTPPVGSRARRAAAAIQPPLLASVPTPAAELRQAAADNPDLIRRAVDDLGRARAIAIYGLRLVGPVINELDGHGHTGTDT